MSTTMMPLQAQTLVVPSTLSVPTSAHTLPAMPTQPVTRPRTKSILKVRKSRSFLNIAQASEGNPESIPRPLKHRFDDVPGEVMNLILDFVATELDTGIDRASLYSCSLVCRSWSRPSRERLFNSPALNTKLSARITAGPQMAAFHDLLLPANPELATIQNYISTLAIFTQGDFLDPFFTLNKGDKKAWLKGSPKAHLHGILKSFVPRPPSPSKALPSLTFAPVLKSLKLMLGTAQTDDLIPLLLDVIQGVVEFELRSAAFSSFSSLCTVLCAGKRLQHLTLTDVNWKKGMSETEENDLLRWRLSPRLARLTVSIRKQGEFLEWIMRTVRMPPIRAVCLGGISSPEDENAVAAFLKRLGPELKHLKLYTMAWVDGVNLTYNTSLQTLSISHYLMGDGTADERLLEILNEISSPLIYKISLQVILQDIGMLDLIDWTSIERALVAKKFRSLRAIQIQVPGETRFVGPVLRERLRRLDGMGVLVIKGDGLEAGDF